MARRRFHPPALCEKCSTPPPVGDTLWHSGVVWLCPACLADETPGDDLITKAAHESVMHDENRALSRRYRAAGDIENADSYEHERRWHGQAVEALKSHGNQRAKNALIAGGEATASRGYLKDTLADPDLVAIESSEMRGKLLLANDIVSLGMDVASTIGASNTLEKLLAHEIALAHKLANEVSVQPRHLFTSADLC